MKISIITVCYNSNEYISQSIESVLAQSHKNLEYIIVDGGSTDGTVETIKGFAANHSWITWISEPDKGIADAMNKGAKLASGEIIGFLHSDDFYPDGEVISSVFNAFKQSPDSMWATGSMYFVNQRGSMTREIKARKYSYKRLVRANIILHPATFVNRDMFLKIGGFDTSFRYAMDYDLWLRLGKLHDPIIIDRVLASFRVHEGSRSIAASEKAYEEEFHVRENYLRKAQEPVFPHRLAYFGKKYLNKCYILSLLHPSN